MLTQKEINEIKEFLEKSQNPLFFFDNDADGLCSFLLLQKYMGKGKGVAIKSFPNLTKEYFRRVQELDADAIFILDKPEVSDEFFEEAHKFNIPIVWIDHHNIKNKIPSFVSYYNPSLKRKTNEPVTALCYQITKKKEDLWIALTGCISDKYSPDFYKDFKKKYPDLSCESSDASDILYNSGIGKICRMLNAGLKNKTSDVIRMIKFLLGAKNPYEVLEETNKNVMVHRRFNEINKRQKMLVERAKKNYLEDKKVLFFKYGGDMSISADLSNEISYIFSDKVVVVVYTTGIKANISVRGKNIKDKILLVIKGLKDSTGGGHDDAVGAMIKVEDVEKFKKGVEKIFKKKKDF